MTQVATEPGVTSAPTIHTPHSCGAMVHARILAARDSCVEIGPRVLVQFVVCALCRPRHEWFIGNREREGREFDHQLAGRGGKRG